MAVSSGPGGAVGRWPRAAFSTAALMLLAGCGAKGTTVSTSPFLEVSQAFSESTLARSMAFIGVFPSPPPTCQQQLAATGTVFIAVPDVKTKHGCGFKNGVIVLTAGDTPLTRPAVLQCKTALKLARWVKQDVQPAARTVLGTSVAKIKVSDHFNCRLKGGRKLVEKKGRRVRKPALSRMSQHAFANAVDISRIWFADGRESHVMLDWHGPMRGMRVNKAGILKMSAKSTADVKRGLLVAFWRNIARSACGHFTKVLTPEYNWLHRHHIHLDLSPGKRCTLDGTVAGGRKIKRKRGGKRVIRRRVCRKVRGGKRRCSYRMIAVRSKSRAKSRSRRARSRAYASSQRRIQLRKAKNKKRSRRVHYRIRRAAARKKRR